MSSAKAIWGDPVWSKVIAGAILAIGGIAISYFLNWWSAIGTAAKNIIGFMGEASSVPNWLIGFGAVCSLLVLFMLAAIIWQTAFPRSKAFLKTWRSYVTDSFFGLRWYWQYGLDNDIYGLYSCCEKCKYQIHPKNISKDYLSTELIFCCDMCGNKIRFFNEDLYEVESKVKRHIQQKLRTGSWDVNVS